MEPDGAHIWEEGQLEGKKEAATSLTLDEVQHSLRPGRSPWKTHGIPIGQLLKLLNAGEEVIDLISSCNTLACSQAANNMKMESLPIPDCLSRQTIGFIQCLSGQTVNDKTWCLSRQTLRNASNLCLGQQDDVYIALALTNPFAPPSLSGEGFP